MNTNFFALTIELLVGFLALLVLTKVLGKTQIAQLTPFDFISALILGELVGNAIYDKDIGLHYVLYAVFVWGALIMLVETITQKYKNSRGLLEGKPTIVIRRGVIDRAKLQTTKLDLDQLQHLLRDKSVFSIQEVEYAILEANGTINVLKKSTYQSVSKSDINIAPNDVMLPITIVSDGGWIDENLQQTPLLKESLQNLFSEQGIEINHVLIAEWSEGEPLYVHLDHAPFIKYLDISSLI
ncbi:DUF421 domain-containing protein [Salipaludibacillus sp. CF4.18]|uniref:DUF421 domain-containing protein n=1 Tax=Salipaludibacillus sp. CF4.18 TaxID=3373081 RepID=UPI003EE530DB